MIESMCAERIRFGPAADGNTDDLRLRAAVHAALAEPTRLAIVDELVLSDRSPSELTASLHVGSNLLAHHLEALEDAGLIRRLPSDGDRRRKYVRLVPEALALAAPPVVAISTDGVLFVCTGNSARSQLAAALWNARNPTPAASAGTRPRARVHPEAVRAGVRAGLDLRGARPRSLVEAGALPGLVVTVCDRAHERIVRGGGPRTRVLHWSIPDPAESGAAVEFDRTVRTLTERIDVLAPLVHPAAP